MTCSRSAAFADQLLEPRIERLRHHQHAGAAVGQHEAVVVSVISVLTGTATAPALRQPRKAVGQSMVSSSTISTRSSRRTPSDAQHRGKARDAVGKLAVGPGSARIDEGRLVGAAGLQIAVEDIGGEIVVARDRAHSGGHRSFRARIGRNTHSHSPGEMNYYASGRQSRNASIPTPPEQWFHDLQPRPHPHHPCRQPAAQREAVRPADGAGGRQSRRPEGDGRRDGQGGPPCREGADGRRHRRRQRRRAAAGSASRPTCRSACPASPACRSAAAARSSRSSRSCSPT